jgi:CheY-like chemotaxis protein
MMTTPEQSALALLATMNPDVLVSDITMPGEDGWWLLREARSRGHLDGTPALEITALELQAEDVTRGGFHAYFRTPIDPQALCNSVQTLARGRKRESV